jgi:hypothetical protein
MQNQISVLSWSEKLSQNIRRSPQKAAMLAGLALVLAVMWGRMLLGGAGPGGASAAIPASPIMTAPNDLPAMGRADHTTLLLQWARQPIVPMRRNLFAIPFAYYVNEQNPVATATGSDGFWSLLAKSLSIQADQQTQRQALVQEMVKSAGSLRLESIMLGAMPTAMINGKMEREGSTVECFRIRKIEARRIIVDNEGIELAITMK